MASQTPQCPFPRIAHADRIDTIEDQFFDFIRILDKQEEKWFNDQPFPDEWIEDAGWLDYHAMMDLDNIDERLARTAHAIWRVDTQLNRIDQIIRWIDSKIAKITAYVPKHMLEYMNQDEKYHRLGNAYPVVAWLVDQRQGVAKDGTRIGYVYEQLKYRNVAKNLERIERLLYHIKNQENKNGKT